MSVIINGDDFGMTKSCSLAICEAIRRGIITNTTMMANGDYFEQAVLLAKENGFSSKTGVHLNLTEGAPLTEKIKSVTLFVRNGFFHKDYLKNPRPLTKGEESAVYFELSAQIKRIKLAGINVLNADSHHYVHTFEYLAPTAARVLKENGIVRVRINRTFSTPERPVITEGRTDNAFWSRQGFKTTRHFGRMSDVSPGNVPDNTEIMVHPDYSKNGVLIDRLKVTDGFPEGTALVKIL